MFIMFKILSSENCQNAHKLQNSFHPPTKAANQLNRKSSLNNGNKFNYCFIISIFYCHKIIESWITRAVFMVNSKLLFRLKMIIYGREIFLDFKHSPFQQRVEEGERNFMTWQVFPRLHLVGFSRKGNCQRFFLRLFPEINIHRKFIV